MQSISRQYVSNLSLDLVNGAQASDRVRRYGAHMNDNLVPQHMFRQWLKCTPEGTKLERNLPWGKEPIMENLPFMVGEGTGMLEAYGYENPHLELMQYVYSMPELEVYKKPIPRREKQPGGFLVGALVGLSDYNYRLGAKYPMGFWYVDRSRGGISRGISYQDMMENSPNVGIIPHPFVSEPIMREMREKVLRRVPPEPLVLTKVNGGHKNKYLDHIVRSVQDLHRPHGNPHNRVPVYVRTHQINEAQARRIAAGFAQKDRIWKVDYVMEPVTDDMFAYRMNVYVH